MHRFFLLNAEIRPGQPVDLSPLSHQLLRVLRLKPGDEIRLLDGDNAEFATEIIQLDHRNALGKILSRTSIDSEPVVHLTLYQSSLKADKFEWILQKGTELGVSTFVPVISQRSVVRPADALFKKYDRWRSIIREAAEQSGRGCLPILIEPVPYAEAVVNANGRRLLAWEEASGMAGVDGLGQVVSQSDKGERTFSLMIGPEGGCTVDEADMARAAGWQVVTLGPRTLRAETAALAGITIVLDRLAELGRLGCRS